MYKAGPGTSTAKYGLLLGSCHQPEFRIQISILKIVEQPSEGLIRPNVRMCMFVCVVLYVVIDKVSSISTSRIIEFWHCNES